MGIGLILLGLPFYFYWKRQKRQPSPILLTFKMRPVRLIDGLVDRGY